MIYRTPQFDEPLDQGDLLDNCPVATVTHHTPDGLDQTKVVLDLHRVIVLTQTCDFANAKAEVVLVASVFDAQLMIDLGILRRPIENILASTLRTLIQESVCLNLTKRFE